MFEKRILQVDSLTNTMSSRQCRSPLHVAVIEGQTDVVAELLQKGANVNAKDSNDKTPLRQALEVRNLSILKLLIDAGADLRVFVDTGSCDDDPSNLLQMAIKTNDVQITKLFLDATKDINEVDDHGNSPLHFAAIWGNTSILKLLLDAGADLEAKDFHERTPLFRAYKSENLDIFKVLIEAGANVNASDDDEITPLHLAVNSHNTAIVKLLIDAGADVHAKSKDKFGTKDFTPLHEVARWGSPEVLKILIEAGANINSTDSSGRTPLLTALDNENFDILRPLIWSGADVHAIDFSGNTALNYIVKSKCLKVDGKNHLVLESLKFLIDFTNVHFVNGNGQNVLSGIMESNELAEERTYFYKIIIEHLAKLKLLDLKIPSSLLKYISKKTKYRIYFAACKKELEKAKSTRLHDCWVTFFNLLVDDKCKFVKYAGNADLVKDFLKNVNNFPIYGSSMLKDLSNGINDRESFDVAAYTLSFHLPIFDPYHLIVKDMLDTLSKEDWKILSNKKRYSS